MKVFSECPVLIKLSLATIFKMISYQLSVMSLWSRSFPSSNIFVTIHDSFAHNNIYIYIYAYAPHSLLKTKPKTSSHGF